MSIAIALTLALVSNFFCVLGLGLEKKSLGLGLVYQVLDNETAN